MILPRAERGLRDALAGGTRKCVVLEAEEPWA